VRLASLARGAGCEHGRDVADSATGLDSELDSEQPHLPQVPDVELSFFDGEGQMQRVSSKDLCSGKKVRLEKGAERRDAGLLRSKASCLGQPAHSPRAYSTRWSSSPCRARSRPHAGA